MGSRSLRLLNQSTHSKVANSTASKLRQGLPGVTVTVHESLRAEPSPPDCEPDAALKSHSYNAIDNMLTKWTSAYAYPAASRCRMPVST